MQLRQALREQCSSLALQRAAMDEIAKLDSSVFNLKTYIQHLEDKLYNLGMTEEEIGIFHDRHFNKL